MATFRRSATLATHPGISDHDIGKPSKPQAMAKTGASSRRIRMPAPFSRETMYDSHEDYEPEVTEEVVNLERAVHLAVNKAVNTMNTAESHSDELAALADIVKQALPPYVTAQLPEPDFVQYPGCDDEDQDEDNTDAKGADAIFVGIMELTWLKPFISITIMRGFGSVNEKRFHLNEPGAIEKFREGIMDSFKAPR